MLQTRKRPTRAPRHARLARQIATTVLGAMVCTTSTPARADTEPPAVYDARSAAMGGSGTTFIDNAAAVFHNPASLGQVKTFGATVVGSPIFQRVEAPFSGVGSEQKSTLSKFPLMLVAGALRVSDRVVVGLGGYFVGGVGAAFENVPAVNGEDLELAVGLAELQVPVSVRVLDNLWLGAGLRLGYVKQNSDLFNPLQGLTLEQDLSGFGFPGFHAGVLYKPIEEFALAVTYRSKMTIDLDGTSTLRTSAGAMEASTKTEWFSPHSIKVGTSLQLLNQRLLLALDVKVQFYKESHKELVARLDVNGAEMEMATTLNWNNTVTFHAGAEWKQNDLLSFRLGTTIGTSASDKTTTLAFFPTPGLLTAFTGGAGFNLDPVDLSAGVVAILASETLDQQTTNGGSPGDYGTFALIASVSGSYKF